MGITAQCIAGTRRVSSDVAQVFSYCHRKTVSKDTKFFRVRKIKQQEESVQFFPERRNK